MYRGTAVSTTDKSNNLGVLCAWYSSSLSPTVFSMEMDEKVHTFIPVSSYICTLPFGCFEKIVNAEGGFRSHTKEPSKSRP